MKKQIKLVDKEKGIAQITTLDERWYAIESKDVITGLPIFKYVPSVTWIAGYYPKGIAFYKWLAEHGWDEAEAIKQAAGDKGSKVHKAIEMWLKGDEVKIDSKFVNPSTNTEEELTPEEYGAVMSFVAWYGEEKPKEVLSSEYVIEGEFYAGTIDLKYQKQDGRIGILDIKSGQNIWPEYELQISAYSYAETTPIDFMEILQVGYRRNRAGYKVTEIQDKFALFKSAYQIWKNENDGSKPSQKDYPLVLPTKSSIDKPDIKVEDVKVVVKTKAVAKK